MFRGSIKATRGASVTAAGATQGTATAISATTSFVVAGIGEDGVQLPVGTPGDVYWICPDSTGQDVKVYPATGGTINQGVANAAVIVDSVRGGVSFVCYAANAWASGVLV